MVAATAPYVASASPPCGRAMGRAGVDASCTKNSEWADVDRRAVASDDAALRLGRWMAEHLPHDHHAHGTAMNDEINTRFEFLDHDS